MSRASAGPPPRARGARERRRQKRRHVPPPGAAWGGGSALARELQESALVQMILPLDMDAHNAAARTPNLHRLSKSGARLDRHYVFKYCSPTRSSLLTGRLPIHVNQNNNANS
ncbi:unnamed protein product [Prorocentrum cordatum]|uniref:Sulfatase N-terminal domain-containing protein n=1 Tax=Prorocentrum cordatum TaxID=2364126 RepID=A0ABN9VEH1_9DINO|nr:unnamed protein product [Polarella glacialis]